MNSTSEALANSYNSPRTVFQDNRAIQLQVLSGLSTPFLIIVMLAIGQPQEFGWVGLSASMAAFVGTLFIPRLRVDVSNKGLRIYEILWWQTTTHHFRSDQLPPEIGVWKSKPWDEDIFYILRLTLPSGRKINLREKGADQLERLKQILLEPWA